MKRNCLKAFAVSFSKINQVSFVAIISLFSYYYHYRNHYYCFLYSRIVYLTLFSIYFLWWIIKYCYSSLFLYLFSFFLFVSYSKFILVPFFFIYFLLCRFPFLLCFKWVHHVLHLLVIIFSLSLLALKKSSEKNAKTIRTIDKTPVPLAFAVVLV